MQYLDRILNELHRAAFFFAVLLILFYILSLGGAYDWRLDLFNHFLHQYLIGSFVLLIWFFLKKSKIFTAFMLITLGMISFEIITSFELSTAPQRKGSDFTLKIVHYNRHAALHHHDDLKEWLKTEKPDFLVLQEAGDTHAKAVAEIKETYPYQHHELRCKNGFCNPLGMVIASKFPMTDIKPVPTHNYIWDNYYIHLTLELPDNRRISVYTMHPPPPMSETLFIQRNEDLKAVTTAIQSDKTPNILFMGDWNITPYSPHFKNIIATTGLKNQHTSSYPFPTWPAQYEWPIFQIPIDHILFKGNLDLLSRKRSNNAMGSDHYPIIAEFLVR